MRLDKFIGNNTGLSRSLIHQQIKAGNVLVNGAKVSKSGLLLNADDIVQVNGQPVVARKPQYIMLHKPIGYVSATTDSEHPTVLDLLELPFKQDLQIAGRLDLDTTGLLLLTDDGQWNHRLTSPRHEHQKIYRVTLADPVTDSAIGIFVEGVLLHGESKKTLPAQLELLDSHCVRLAIHEGKYHQVKRMFAAIGNRVVALHREQIGQILLDANLPPGAYRALTNDEIASIGDAS